MCRNKYSKRLLQQLFPIFHQSRSSASLRLELNLEMIFVLFLIYTQEHERTGTTLAEKEYSLNIYW